MGGGVIISSHWALSYYTLLGDKEDVHTTLTLLDSLDCSSVTSSLYPKASAQLCGEFSVQVRRPSLILFFPYFQKWHKYL